MEVTNEYIQSRIEKPQNGASLSLAKSHQKKLKDLFYYCEDAQSHCVYEKYKPAIPAKGVKRNLFLSNFDNVTMQMLNSALVHYNKIFDAHGRRTELKTDTEDDGKAKALVAEARMKLYEGESDDKWWRGQGVEMLMTEPNSLLLTINKGEDPKDGEGLIVELIGLDKIHDVTVSKTGEIEELILFGQKGKAVHYYYYWKGFYQEVVKAEGGYFFDNEQPVRFQELEKTPAVFLGGAQLYANDPIPLKSLISDSVEDLMAFSFFSTCYKAYKTGSAYPTEVKPEVRCDYRNEQSQCQDGQLLSLENGETMGACPNCAGKANRGLMGEIVEIPLSQQDNADFLSNISSLYFKLESSDGILRFHTEDLKQMRNQIMIDMLGRYTGGITQDVAKNEMQVQSNFDTQEAVLHRVKTHVEDVWNYTVNRAINVSSNLIGKWVIYLGNKFFLKEPKDLYEELDLMIKTGSNFADIEAKRGEIIQTNNPHNPELIHRHVMINALQPYSGLSQEYILSSRDTLKPESLALYENFTNLLAEWEIANGPIQNYRRNAPKSTVISEIKKQLIEMLNGSETGD